MGFVNEDVPRVVNDPVTRCVSVGALPIVTPVPVTVSSVILALVIVNCVGETEAEKLDVAIWVKFRPITPEAGTVEANEALKAFVANEAIVENDELAAFKI